jgi:hypothetical protein
MTNPLLIILVGFFTLASSLNQELLLAPALSALYLYITGLVAVQLSLSWRRNARTSLKTYTTISSTKLFRLSVLSNLYSDLNSSFENKGNFVKNYLKFFRTLDKFRNISLTDFEVVSKKRFYFNFITEAVVEQFLFIKNRFLFFASRPLDRSIKKLLSSRSDLSYNSFSSSIGSKRRFSSFTISSNFTEKPTTCSWWLKNASSF